MENKVINAIWFIDEHIGKIVGTTLVILLSPILLYIIYLVCDYFYTSPPKRKKTCRRCHSCGGKLKFSHISDFPDRCRVYQCTRCHSFEWVLCSRKKRRRYYR